MPQRGEADAACSEPIAVAVVVRDRFSTFPECLEALLTRTHTPFRVTAIAGAVDVETTAELRRLASRLDNVDLVLRDRLMTQAELRRCALERIQERYCVLLENDTIVHDNWLEPMLRCMRREQAAVVTPLVMWHRGVHASGCEIKQLQRDGVCVLSHTIVYSDRNRRPIDYPETHCVLLDLDQLRGINLFDEVEPFDVDVGLTLKAHGCKTYLEPESVVTYAAAPPWELRDIPAAAFRWNTAAWKRRNDRFVEKWSVAYDPSAKLASYRRHELKLALVRRYPSRGVLALTNLCVRLFDHVVTRLTRMRVRRSFG